MTNEPTVTTPSGIEITFTRPEPGVNARALPNAGIKIVEEQVVDGAYGFRREMLIIDHPRHGRLLLAEEYCGETELRGGQYRWGSVHRLQPDDTFGALAGEWNECTTILEAVEMQHDDSRPWLDWPPLYVERMAHAATGGAA